MKKALVIIILLFIFTGCDKFTNDVPVVKETFILETNQNVQFEYASDAYLFDLINSTDEVEIENIKLDTMSLGEHIIKFNFSNRGNKYEQEIKYIVVDTTKPLLLMSSSYSVEKGKEVNLVNKAICADNHDKRPNCYIEGTYDFNKVGTYNLKYHAVDASGNSTSKEFKLKVIKPAKKKETQSKPKYKIEDLISKHKSDKTMVGIDVSSWQGDVDYQKVKEAGVEFVIIRLGFGHNKKGELVLDSKFTNNIKKAKEAGLLVGIYFYSYANTIEKVKEQVNYIMDNLNNESLDLPIAFDWEDWGSFNTYNMSLTDIRIIAKTFIDEVEKRGYKGALYSSKYYLEQIWGIDKYNTWLAHYTNETSYKGKYFMWQLSNRGKVAGINGDVDFDILYK